MDIGLQLTSLKGNQQLHNIWLLKGGTPRWWEKNMVGGFDVHRVILHCVSQKMGTCS